MLTVSHNGFSWERGLEVGWWSCTLFRWLLSCWTVSKLSPHFSHTQLDNLISSWSASLRLRAGWIRGLEIGWWPCTFSIWVFSYWLVWKLLPHSLHIKFGRFVCWSVCVDAEIFVGAFLSAWQDLITMFVGALLRLDNFSKSWSTPLLAVRYYFYKYLVQFYGIQDLHHWYSHWMISVLWPLWEIFDWGMFFYWDGKHPASLH